MADSLQEKWAKWQSYLKEIAAKEPPISNQDIQTWDGLTDYMDG